MKLRVIFDVLFESEIKSKKFKIIDLIYDE